MSQCPVLTGTPVGSITVVRRKSNLSGPLPLFIVVTGRTKFSPGFTAIADIGLPFESATDTILSASNSI